MKVSQGLASSAITLVLKMCICSNIIDILGNVLRIRGISHLLMQDFLPENTRGREKTASNRADPGRKIQNTHVYTPQNLVAMQSAVCYEPHPPARAVTECLPFRKHPCQPPITVLPQLQPSPVLCYGQTPGLFKVRCQIHCRTSLFLNHLTCVKPC